MNRIRMFREAGISFKCSPNTMFSEVPYVQDVLCSLGLSKEEKRPGFCRANHETHIDNIRLVINIVGFEIMSMRPYSEAKARRIIAEAIIDLCPATACCFFNSAFVDAKEIFTGLSIPMKGVDSETVRRACGCPSCTASFEPESAFTD